MLPLREGRLKAVEGRAPALADLYCRPTRLGAGLAVVVVLLWLVGLNYQVNLAYAAAFWLAGFLAAAALFNLRQLLALQIEAALPREVFAGEDAQPVLSAAKPARARRLWLRSGEGGEGVWQEWVSGPDGLPPFHWRIPALMRGYLRVPPLRAASAAPFGVSVVQCVYRWQLEAVVFPAPLPHEIPAPQAGGGAGLNRTPVPGSDDLAYLQAHTAGASLQHVAWKTYAKTGEMLDKRFEEVRQAAPRHVISYTDYPAVGDKERLAGLLCFRVLEAERLGLAYTLELPQRTVAPQAGQREICLTALALW